MLICCASADIGFSLRRNSFVNLSEETEGALPPMFLYNKVLSLWCFIKFDLPSTLIFEDLEFERLFELYVSRG